MFLCYEYLYSFFRVILCGVGLCRIVYDIGLCLAGLVLSLFLCYGFIYSWVSLSVCTRACI